MRFRFKKCKNRRCLLIERQYIVSRRAGNLRTRRNNEKGPKNQAVYSDGTWVHANYTMKIEHDEIPGVMVKGSARQRAIVTDILMLLTT
jgi:hypothetical protein